VIVAPALGSRLVRLHPDGSIDPTFVTGGFEAAFGFGSTLRFHQLLAQQDGRLLVSGTFASIDGEATNGLVRLQRDGSRDLGFTPPSELRISEVTSSPPPRRLALQSDGKLLVLSTQGLVRLLADGRMDPTFNPAVAVNNNVGTFAVASDDAIYVTLNREQVVTRLLPNGDEDTAFTRRALDVSPLSHLHVLADGRLLVSGARIFPTRPVSRIVRSLARWNADGSPDPSYPVLDAAVIAGPAPDGSLLLPERTLLQPDGSRTTLNFGHAQFESLPHQPYPAVFGPEGHLYMFGGFDFHHGVRSSRIVRLNRVPAGAAEVAPSPRILAVWSDASAVTLGETTTLRVAAIAPGPVTYEWRQLNPSGSLATTIRTSTPTFAFSPQFLGDPSNFSVRVLNGAGEATSGTVPLTVTPALLRIVDQPHHVALSPGRQGSLHVTVNRHSHPTSAAWLRDGQVVARDWAATAPRLVYGEDGATGDRLIGLELGTVTPEHAGDYVLELTNATGALIRSAPIRVTTEDTPRFVNLSTRAFVGTGERAVVLGFVIPPGASRAVAVRGIGPSLAQFGVTAPLQDARLELFDASGRQRGANDHWREYSGSLSGTGAFPLAVESKDAALANGALPPGSYTVRLSGPPGATGSGLIELYETDDRSDRFVNLSTRAFLEDPSASIIAGFAVRGTRPKRVLVRAVGPALAAFGVRHPLANPQLTVRDERGDVVATNDNWSEQSSASAIAAAASAAGAFPFAADSRDAAVLVDLPAGNFTGVLTSATAAETGVASVEVYEVR
jgi:uncharacterized delta-60 repeat protein